MRKTLFALFLTNLSQNCHGGMTTILYFGNVTNYASFQFANISVTYDKEGDLSSYRVHQDVLFKQDMSFYSMRFKVIKFPSIKKFENGSVLTDITFDICNEIKRNKKRKSDLYYKALNQMWEKFGNVPSECPVKKGSYSIRGLTLNEINIPFMQYILKDDDYQFIYTLQTKIKRKLTILHVQTYTGGSRRTAA